MAKETGTSSEMIFADASDDMWMERFPPTLPTPEPDGCAEIVTSVA
jgi:hypothetical protein